MDIAIEKHTRRYKDRFCDEVQKNNKELNRDNLISYFKTILNVIKPAYELFSPKCFDGVDREKHHHNCVYLTYYQFIPDINEIICYTDTDQEFISLYGSSDYISGWISFFEEELEIIITSADIHKLLSEQYFPGE